jgi:hypothetical protein
MPRIDIKFYFVEGNLRIGEGHETALMLPIEISFFDGIIGDKCHFSPDTCCHFYLVTRHFSSLHRSFYIDTNESVSLSVIDMYTNRIYTKKEAPICLRELRPPKNPVIPDSRKYDPYYRHMAVTPFLREAVI